MTRDNGAYDNAGNESTEDWGKRVADLGDATDDVLEDIDENDWLRRRNLR